MEKTTTKTLIRTLLLTKEGAFLMHRPEQVVAVEFEQDLEQWWCFAKELEAVLEVGPEVDVAEEQLVSVGKDPQGLLQEHWINSLLLFNLLRSRRLLLRRLPIKARARVCGIRISQRGRRNCTVGLDRVLSISRRKIIRSDRGVWSNSFSSMLHHL